MKGESRRSLGGEKRRLDLKAFLELVHSGLNSLVKILCERLCRPREDILPGQVNDDENEYDDNHLGDEERPRYLVK